MVTRSILLVSTLALICGVPAFGGDADTTRQAFQLPKMAALDLPFSDAVLVGDTMYLSGSGGIDVDTMTVPDDPKEEARLLMEQVRETLAMADMTMEDLVSVTVYCPDLSLYKAFNEVYRSYFKGSFPARAFVGSGPLLFGMRFEMQSIAVRR